MQMPAGHTVRRVWRGHTFHFLWEEVAEQQHLDWKAGFGIPARRLVERLLAAKSTLN